MSFDFRRIKAEPGTGGPPCSAEFHQVLEDRLEQVDRYGHIALHGAAAQFFLNHQRAYPEEPPAYADQRGAAPMRMRRGGEERLIQYVLPVAGKLAPRDELGLERMLAAAVTGDDDIVADAAGSCSAPWKRRRGQLAERLHQSEAGRLIIGERMTRDRRTLVRVQPDGRRFGDQIADREHESIVANDDTVADPLGTQDPGGKGVLRNLGAQKHHRVERCLQVEAQLLGIGLHLGRKRPVAQVSHGDFPRNLAFILWQSPASCQLPRDNFPVHSRSRGRP